ncbi:Flap endonuclease 1 [Sesamum angolense]|uniref:Flap endonuclease 1 n=1 Tax=Sesamum angolense TaxID=2727404 RepID=A0AAE1WZC9_9LAMI|nr:Flap endonuclease 1 [Sesamum angolense]
MGIKGLTKLLADNAPKAMKEQKFESYFGRKIAIDASMSIYQFLVRILPFLCVIAYEYAYAILCRFGYQIVVGRSGTEMLTNEAGEVTSHLQGMFTRTIRLLEAGIKPVYVFDGKPPDLKKQELAKRYSKRADATEDLSDALETGNKEDIEKFSKRTVKVTKQHNEDCKKLLKLMGVPVIEAPSEAEAQCAELCKADKVYAVASEDMDSLTFGAPRFLRHLMDPSSKKIPVMEFEVSKVLEELNLTMDQFIDLCILSGCDYCDSIRGIGGQTALKLIRQHGSIENILENINKERYQIPDDWPYQEARRLFKEPSVFADDNQLELKWSPPDEEGLTSFLVNENGFNSDRVTKAIEKIKAAKNKSSQGRLESFFKPVANPSVPAKRKVCQFSLTLEVSGGLDFFLYSFIMSTAAGKVCLPEETTQKTVKESANKKTKAGVAFVVGLRGWVCMCSEFDSITQWQSLNHPRSSFVIENMNQPELICENLANPTYGGVAISIVPLCCHSHPLSLFPEVLTIHISQIAFQPVPGCLPMRLGMISCVE